jgi:hypothetical protein
MNLPRRSFLKTSLAASTTAALGSSLGAATPAGSSPREFYELRCYRLRAESRLKSDANAAVLDRYLERALLPALEERGLRSTGVFTELDVDRKEMKATPKAGSPVWVLIPHATLESFVEVSASIVADGKVQETGAEYLRLPKEQPGFERIDTWLLLAFQSMPRVELPEFSRQRVPTRVFEMRDYESYSEVKALAKMAMFDDGETEIMRSLGMAPVFFGQALAGPDLPHLRYITGGRDLASHFASWAKFGPDSRWQKMKDLPQYADTVSRNTARFLAPKPYSNI